MIDIKISRSLHETFAKCLRKGYYEYLYQGGGYSTTRPRWNLSFGLAVHEGLETLMKTASIEEAVVAGQEKWAREMAPFKGDASLAYSISEGHHFTEALLRGWHRARWPGFNEEWEIISIEQEVQARLAPGIILQARADLVARERATRRVFVWNWKTAASTKDWTHKWENEVQMWTEALAIEDSLGEPVAGVIVEGFHKGQPYKGLSSSPLIRPWLNPDGIWSSVYKPAPFKRAGVWNHTFPSGDGVAGWIDWIDPETLSAEFVRSAPILKNDDVVRAWLRQVVRLHTDIRHVMESPREGDRLDFFLQNFGEFTCGQCPFIRICKGEMSVEGAVEGGLLRPREDHHDTSGTEG